MLTYLLIGLAVVVVIVWRVISAAEADDRKRKGGRKG